MNRQYLHIHWIMNGDAIPLLAHREKSYQAINVMQLIHMRRKCAGPWAHEFLKWL